ncbi:MAG: hypothetical protein VZQ62_00875 [Methanosphaera sp.]|nr:hypothetical protein [Methanosphaera sp.]
MNIEYNKKKTTIYDSYLMKNVSKEVKEIIKERKEKGYKTNRSLNSYIRETKAHNRLYKLGLFKKHTKNTDLEENIKLWKEIAYFIIGI